LRKYGNALLADWREMMRTGKSVALITTTLAAVQWIARFSIATLVIGAAGATMQPALHWFLQWAVQTLGSVVPTPGGAGGAEAAFLIFFAPFLGENELVPAMTIWRLVFFYLPLTAAAVLFFILGTRREEEAKNTQP
jgi:glycosyltransferase 2 family protein